MSSEVCRRPLPTWSLPSQAVHRDTLLSLHTRIHEDVSHNTYLCNAGIQLWQAMLHTEFHDDDVMRVGNRGTGVQNEFCRLGSMGSSSHVEQLQSFSFGRCNFFSPFCFNPTKVNCFTLFQSCCKHTAHCDGIKVKWR